MGWDPRDNQLHELTPEYLANHPEAQHFQKFREGETVLVRGEADIARPCRAKFRVESISENRMTLIAVGAVDNREEFREKLMNKAAELEAKLK